MITVEDLNRMKFVPQPTQDEIDQERKAVKDQVERMSTLSTLL